MKIYKIKTNVSLPLFKHVYLPINIKNESGLSKKLSLSGNLNVWIKFGESVNIQLPRLFFWLETKNDNCHE